MCVQALWIEMRSASFVVFRRMREGGNCFRPAQVRSHFSPLRHHLQGFEQIKGEAVAAQNVVRDLSCWTADVADTLPTLQLKNKQFRTILQTLRWPRLKHVEADGILYDLPVSHCDRPPALSWSTEPPSLQYLAGFFDGDGCVSCQSDLSGCTIGVNQSFDTANVLMLFLDTFGGNVSREADGLGLKKPTLQWRVHGAKASLAASLLVPHSITKQTQLALATEWPNDRSCREDYKAKLVARKRCDSAVPGACSWEYLAGFFDAEGCILPSSRWSLQLKIVQKFPTVLKCIQSFLLGDLGINSRIYLSRSGSLLRVTGCTSSKQVLNSMLQSGLLCKAAQAELAMRMGPQDAGQVRVGLSKLKGNQHFGRKLDEAGQERARNIKSLQNSAHFLERRGELQAAEALKVDLEIQKQEHALLNARLENQLLLEYAHQLQGLHDASWAGP